MAEQTNDKQQKLEQLKRHVSSCILCKLATTRSQVVFGEGNANAKVLFIGEGPGRVEDQTGRPFVGRSGELLTKMIEQQMHLQRSEVFIANIVKCRPTVNMLQEKDRAPDKEEVAACSPYLLEQIKIISPQAIVTLGGPSTKFILQTNTGITRLRGQWNFFHNIPVMPTYHPSYILRNGGERSQKNEEFVSDLKKVLAKLDSPKQILEK